MTPFKARVLGYSAADRCFTYT